MAAPSGAIGRFLALPFPARLAAGFLGVMAVMWLSRWLGGLSALLAVLLWCAAGIGLWRAGGGLAWVDRHAWATRALDGLAPRIGSHTAPAWPGAAPLVVPAAAADPAAGAAAAPRSGERPASPTRPLTPDAQAAPDLARFVGLDDVFMDINRLVTARARRISTIAPATVALLAGPRGTGKSSVARALAAELCQAGGPGAGRIVTIGPMEVPGLAGSYGPSDTALSGLTDRIHAALDGALLIDDLDWLTGAPGGQAAAEAGSRLLAVAQRYPGRLFVIGTGSAAAVNRLDPANRWLGQLNVRRIDFPAPGTRTLRDIFARLLDEKGLRLAAGAERAVDIQIEERRTQSGDAFDNAHAIRRLVDAVLHNHGLRLHGDPDLPADERRIVTAEDVRNATPAL